MTVKEFYDYCVEHNIDDHKMMIYYVTQFGDITASGELRPDGIHLGLNENEKRILLYFEDTV